LGKRRPRPRPAHGQLPARPAASGRASPPAPPTSSATTSSRIRQHARPAFHAAAPPGHRPQAAHDPLSGRRTHTHRPAVRRASAAGRCSSPSAPGSRRRAPRGSRPPPPRIDPPIVAFVHGEAFPGPFAAARRTPRRAV